MIGFMHRYLKQAFAMIVQENMFAQTIGQLGF